LESPGYREKQNAKARNRSREVKEWISAYKLERGCIDCGYRENSVALDIDHMDGKTINVSHAKSIGAAIEEIERHSCVVRCANCHRIKTFETRAWEAKG
jgi:hypothetical protein